MDETAIYMNMVVKKTINKSVNTILIRTKGQELVKVYILLSIIASGGKLTPIIIMKRSKRGNIEKNLNNLNIMKNKKAYIFCNSKA